MENRVPQRRPWNQLPAAEKELLIARMNWMSSEIERLENERFQDGMNERKAFLARDRKKEDMYWKMGEKKAKRIENLKADLSSLKSYIPQGANPETTRKNSRGSSELHQSQKCPCGCGSKPGRFCQRKKLKNKLAALEKKIDAYKAAGYLPGSRKGLNTALNSRDKIKAELDFLPS